MQLAFKYVVIGVGQEIVGLIVSIKPTVNWHVLGVDGIPPVIVIVTSWFADIIVAGAGDCEKKKEPVGTQLSVPITNDE